MIEQVRIKLSRMSNCHFVAATIHMAAFSTTVNVNCHLHIVRLFFGRFRKNSLKKNSPISKNSLIFAETHGKKDPETEISANFSYLTMIPAIINLRKNEFSLVLLTITTWSLKNSLIKKKLTTFFPKTHQFLLKNSLKIPKTQFLTTFGSKPESKNAQKKAWLLCNRVYF